MSSDWGRRPHRCVKDSGHYHYYEKFRYCPFCGSAYRESDFLPGNTAFQCHECDEMFYQNASPSATAVIPDALNSPRILLITRNTPPAIGMLALPGGFLDYDELPEQTVVREIHEETGLTIRPLKLLRVSHIDYMYKDAYAQVLEHSFLTEPVDPALPVTATQEAQYIGFYDINAIILQPERLAFPEHIEVMQNYLAFIRHAINNY